MTESLPTNSYEWMSPKELEELDVANMDLDSDTGYVLECEEIIYPPELHSFHEEFPMIAEKCLINYENLSPLSQKIHDEVFPEKDTNSGQIGNITSV